MRFSCEYTLKTGKRQVGSNNQDGWLILTKNFDVFCKMSYWQKSLVFSGTLSSRKFDWRFFKKSYIFEKLFEKVLMQGLYLWNLVALYFLKKWCEVKMTTSIMKQHTLIEIIKKITGQDKLKYNQNTVIAFGNGGHHSFGSRNQRLPSKQWVTELKQSYIV